MQRLAPLLLALPCSGCCGLYELWGCGPRQPLVPITYDSPRQALDTFRAAVRFQDAKVLYETMSEAFKREQGFDALSFTVFWEKLLDEHPAVPALGDARIVASRWLTPDEKEFTLETYGQQLQVSFARTLSYEYGELRDAPPAPETPADPGAAPEPAPEDELLLISAYLDSPLKDVLVLSGETGSIALKLTTDDLLGIDWRSFAYVRVGRTWKLRSLTFPEPQQ